MKKAEEMLKVGDWIVHSYHGIGQVQGYDTKTLGEEKRMYFIVKTPALEYWLPVTECRSEHLRKVSSSAMVNEAVRVLSSTPQEMDSDFRVRNKHIHDEQEKGSLLAKATLIRDLYTRKKIKGFSENENMVYEKLVKQFINEWTVISKIKPSTAQSKINQALKESFEKYQAQG